MVISSNDHDTSKDKMQKNLIHTLLLTLENNFSIKNYSLWMLEKQNWRCLYPGKPTLKTREIINQMSNQQSAFENFDYIAYQVTDFIFICQKTKYTPLKELNQFMKEYDLWISLLGHYMLKEKKESSVLLFKNASHLITTSLREENYLDIMMQSAIDSVPSADTGFLFLFDQKSKKLFVKSAVGFKKESYLKTRLDPGEGVSGQAFEKGTPILIHGKNEILAAMQQNMTKENHVHYINSTVSANYPHAMISSPLLYNDEKLGVITLDSFQENAQFYQEDIETLTTLSDYIAVGINLNRLYKKDIQTKKELEVIHHALRNEHEQLQKTTDLYNELTGLATKEGSLNQMMSVIYKNTNAPIVLYDPLLKEAASSGITKKHILPTDFLNYREVKYCIKNKKWQTIALDQGGWILIVPVIDATSIIGFLCAWIDSTQALESNRLLLELGATVLALGLMRENSIKEAERKFKGELIDQLLTGEIDNTSIKQAGNLGFSENDYYSVIICEAKNTSLLDISGHEKEIWIRWMENLVGDSEIDITVTYYKEDIIAIISIPQSVKKQEIQQEMKKVERKCKKLNREVYIAIGRVYDSFYHLNNSFHDAQQCMKLLRRLKKENVLRYEDIGVYRFLLEHDKTELHQYIQDTLGPLMVYEEQKNSELLKTLMYYVKFNRDLTTIVSELNIHQNTLYYRLHRIEEILQISFQDYESWFNIQFACKVYQFINN